MQTKQIVSHSAFDYAQQIQEAVIEGFRVSDKGAYFPYTLNGLSIITLVKEDDIQGSVSPEGEAVASVEDAVTYNPDLIALAEVIDLVEQEGAARISVEDKPKRGRKPKEA